MRFLLTLSKYVIEKDFGGSDSNDSSAGNNEGHIRLEVFVWALSSPDDYPINQKLKKLEAKSTQQISMRML